MTSQPFRLILPDQKRLREAFNSVLVQAGFEFSKPTSRAASGLTRDSMGLLPDIETYEFRSEAALEWLDDGAADLAIVGQDTLMERAAAQGDQPQSLISMDRISACSMWIAARPEMYILNLKDLESMRIATSYPALLQQILDKQGVKAGRIIAQKGGVESTITAGRADAILEIVQTGESLKQNGLVKKLPVFNSCAQLVRGTETKNTARESLIAAFTARINDALQPKPILAEGLSVKTPAQAPLNMVAPRSQAPGLTLAN